MDDELTTPLGGNAKKSKRKRLKLPFTAMQAAVAMLALALMVCAGWAVMVNDPLGGEPVAVVATNAGAKSETLPAVISGGGIVGPTAQQPQSATQAQSPAAPPASAAKTITIIDGSTGKRQEVAIPSVRDARAPLEQRLLETSRHGPIPRIAPDGLRPAEAYAQGLNPLQARKTGPRIAVIVGGLGVSSNVTKQAMEKLPAAITLAFLPYGTDAESLATNARATGHEILLHTPMEPFDYPDNDPGPQTLLSSLGGDQNLDRLTWLMSRLQGYVGLVNYMGARFTSSEPSLAPVLKDVAHRGLIYIDDGSSSRSLAGQVAAVSNLPFAKAEVVLDSVPTPTHIDGALARLEALARQHGSAVGFASAQPVSIDRIAQWAKGAEARGFVLVPITAVAVKPKSS